MYTRNSYNGALKPSWCKGCSFGNIRKSLNDVLFKLQYNPLNTTIVSGIGCSSRFPLFSGTFGMHTLHGRAIPVAVGAHLSRPDMPVIVTAGDGDLFSIGTGHFVYAARKNFNITVFCLNNKMYALTRNQSSPTSSLGHIGSYTPFGNQTMPLNLIEFALSCKATFIARTTTFTPDHMNSIVEQALLHNGFSFVDVVAPCKTFDIHAYSNAKEQHFLNVNTCKSHKIEDSTSALLLAAKAHNTEIPSSAPIYIGVFFKSSRC